MYVKPYKTSVPFSFTNLSTFYLYLKNTLLRVMHLPETRYALILLLLILIASTVLICKSLWIKASAK